jgi:ribosomal protein L7/L12
MKYEDIKVPVMVGGVQILMGTKEVAEHTKKFSEAQARIDAEFERISAVRRSNNAEAIRQFAEEMTAITHGIMGNKIKAIKLIRTVENGDGHRLSLYDAKCLVEALVNSYEKTRS